MKLRELSLFPRRSSLKRRDFPACRPVGGRSRRLAVEPLEQRRMLSGITILPVDGSETTEAGGTVELSVRLDSSPPLFGEVDVSLTSSEPTEGTVFPAELSFDSGNS